MSPDVNLSRLYCSDSYHEYPWKCDLTHAIPHVVGKCRTGQTWSAARVTDAGSKPSSMRMPQPFEIQEKVPLRTCAFNQGGTNG